MKRPIAIAAAIGFVLFMITIVIIADRGEGGRWWGFLEHIPFGDKLGHLGLMGTLSLLCNVAFPPRRFSGFRRFLTTTTLVLLVLVTLEEVAQAFLPHRSCDALDWLADLAGLAIGQWLAAVLRMKFLR